jgi:CRP/FNR family transcriptional regulator
MHRPLHCAGLAKLCPSHADGFCRHLDGTAFATLAASAHVEHLPPGRVLWHDDDGPPMAGVLLSGLLRFERCNSQGRRQILNLILPGELVGWETDRASGYSIEAATEATVCRFDPALFDRLVAKDQSLRTEVYRQNVRQLDRLRWLTWAIGALAPEERVAAFLVSATDYMPLEPQAEGGPILTVLISRRDIADLLATTVESICRILKSLEREGLIVLRDPWTVQIPDLDALAERGGVPRAGHRPRSGTAAKAGGSGQAILVTPGAAGPAQPGRRAS